MLPGSEEGDVEHIEGEKSSCWALKAQTCDCCLYLEEQKGMDAVKGRRQSRLKYSVDSCSGGDSAHCGGPACDVSSKGSVGRHRETGVRLPFYALGLHSVDFKLFPRHSVHLALLLESE